MIERFASAVAHLRQMTDGHGLFEHAAGRLPRSEHGYCTDDNARLLAAMAVEPDEGDAADLSRVAYEFISAAQHPDGRTRNRMDCTGRWLDDFATDDCWGRSLWAFGVAASCHGDLEVRTGALAAFDRGARQRSRWRRSMAFAAIGAAAVLTVEPDHTSATLLLSDALERMGEARSVEWVWPEARLAYANAVIPEVLLAGGAALGRPEVVERGLVMLDWLVWVQSRGGFLSVVGTAGRGADDVAPQFDQQPIEIAALADAAARAHALTGDDRWRAVVEMAGAWFEGDNDAGVAMCDETGGGYDGLHADGVNLNQGAESTLALVSTIQRVRSFAVGSALRS